MFLQQYDPESAWWNFCAVGNYASRFYVFTLPAIQALQQQLFGDIYSGALRLESRVTLMSQAAAVVDASGASAPAGQQQEEGWVKEAVSLITEFTTQSGSHISTAWRDFLPTLFSTYRDGQIVTTNLTYIIRKSMFYPNWWLNLVGYWNIPGNANGIYFEGRPKQEQQEQLSSSRDYQVSAAGPETASWTPVWMAAAAMMVFGFAAGRHSAAQNRRKDYIPIAGGDQL